MHQKSFLRSSIKRTVINHETVTVDYTIPILLEDGNILLKEVPPIDNLTPLD